MNVWVFAEERTGSSWLSLEISKRLNLKYGYVESLISTYDTVIHTHNFQLLKDDIKDIVICTTRKNVFEHMLSYIFLYRTKITNPEFYNDPHIYYGNFKMSYDFQKMIEHMKIEIDKKEILDFINLKKERIQLLNEYKPNYIIYYEDLYKGISIPELGLNNIKFSDGGIMEKLPYDKRKIFVNWQQAENWLKEYYE